MSSGYPIPDQITGHPKRCLTIQVPDDTLYLAVIAGAIHSLGQWFNWDKTGIPGDTRATQAAAYWRNEFLPTLTIDSCQSAAPGVGGGSDIPD